MRKIWIIPAIGIAVVLGFALIQSGCKATSDKPASQKQSANNDTSVITSSYKIFPPLTHKVFANAKANTVHLRKYVIGISLHGASKAYPLQYIAVHHDLIDTVGNEPVFITYCALCRSGRVYKPVVDGEYTTFRLIGWFKDNSVFEDATTKSKWRQEDGKAIQGPMQGEYLEDIPSQQMTLGSWIQLHPNTLILQRDSEYDAKYETMKGFAGGWTKTTALKTDTISWQPKSWIVGVLADDKAKAYDWRALRRVRVVNDTVGNTSDVVLVEPDMKSFHVYDRKVGREILTFEPSNGEEFLYDKQTHSLWNYYGECTDGPLKGKRLTPLRAYQEFLESWCTFHPNTTRMTITG